MSFNLNTYLILGSFLINISAAIGSYYNALSDIKSESSKLVYDIANKQNEIYKNTYVTKEEFLAYKDILLDVRSDIKRIIITK
jgi:hypothetical protein